MSLGSPFACADVVAVNARLCWMSTAKAFVAVSRKSTLTAVSLSTPRWRRWAGRSPLRLSRSLGWRQHDGQSCLREPSWRSWMGVDRELADTRCFGLSVNARQSHGDSVTVVKEVRRE